MGLFDKAKKLAEEHAEQVSSAIDKVADVVDDKTGGKFADKIDKGAAAAKNFVDGDDEHEPAAPPAAPGAQPGPSSTPPAP